MRAIRHPRGATLASVLIGALLVAGFTPPVSSAIPTVPPTTDEPTPTESPEASEQSRPSESSEPPEQTAPEQPPATPAPTASPEDATSDPSPTRPAAPKPAKPSQPASSTQDADQEAAATGDEADVSVRSVGTAQTWINSNNTWYAYVGPDENLDVSFVKDGREAAGNDATLRVRGPGGVNETCTVAAATPVGTPCALPNLVSDTPGIWQIDFSDPVVNGDRFTWAIDVQAGATSRPGRVYSEEYRIAQFSGTPLVDLTFYYLSENGYLYEATYADFNGINSIFTADATGVAAVGTCVSAYRSMDLGSATLHDPPTGDCGDAYKLFFEEPDPSMPDTAALWDESTTWLTPPEQQPELSNLAFTPERLDTRAGQFSFEIADFTGQLSVEVDGNNDGDYGDPQDAVVPAAVTADETVTVEWNGLARNGQPVSAFSDINARVAITRVGEIHFANVDVEARGGGLQVLALNGPEEGSDTLYWNDSGLSATGRCGGGTLTPDGTDGPASTGGVHGWGVTGCPSFGNGTPGSWGNNRVIDDWTYHAIDESETLTISASTLPPLTCSADPFGYLFQTQTTPTDAIEVNLVTGAWSAAAQDFATALNAVGYNPVDDFMYAFSVADPLSMVRIGDGFTVEPIGLPSNWATFPGLPAALRDGGPGVGEITPDGVYWVARNVTPQGYQWAAIDLDPASPDFLEVIDAGTAAAPTGVNNLGADWSYNVADGDLYSVSRNTPIDQNRFSLTRFDTATGTLSTARQLGVLDHPTVTASPAGFGATYADSDGFLYASENTTGGIWRVNMSAGGAPFFAAGPPSPGNDGARCYDAPVPIDFGDGPGGFGTDLAGNGPRHAVPGYDADSNTAPLMLGSLIDTEADGAPSGGADGDDVAADDEDAVSGPIRFTAGQPATVPVTVTNDTADEATLAAWADLNGNGAFDAAERVLATVPANSGTTSVDVDFGAPFPTCQTARFRLFPGSVDDPSPTGPAAAGEVEDHAVITEPDCTEDDVPRTVSGVAQAWTPNSQVQSTNLPASLAINGPDRIGAQLYSAAVPANVLTLDLAAVVPQGNAVTLHLAQASSAWSGPVRVTSSADGVTFGNPVTFTPTTAAPTYQEFDYIAPANGVRFVRIVPLAVAGTHSAVRVDAVTYTYEYCECENAVNFVEDGDFEEFRRCSTQTGTFGAWSVIQHSAHIWGDDCPQGWATPEGVNSIDLDGQATGGIQQTLTGLTPGNSYNLSFYMAFNPAAGAASSSMRVTVGDFGRTYTSASNATLGGFNLVHVEFTADSATEVLRFQSLTGTNNPTLLNGGGTSGYGVVLDDIRVSPMNCDEVPYLDYGDAPNTYGTTIAATGPSHAIPGYDVDANTAPLMLGASIDAEDDGQPNATATGDGGDEDALGQIVFQPGSTTATLSVPVTNGTGSAATLYGWIDANGNGTFEPSEFATVAVPAGATSVNLSFAGLSPLRDGSQPAVRLRLTSDALTDNTATAVDERARGAASDGEVEDYLAQVATPVPISCVDPFVETFGVGTGYGPALPAGQTTYAHTTSGFVVDGTYALPSVLPGTFGSWWHPGSDHTAGDTNGRMMLVNASFTAGQFFQRTFTGLVPGADYDFAAWITNANRAGSPILPNVSFRVVDPATGNVLSQVNTGNIPNAGSLIWNRYAMQFTATQSTVRLELVNIAAGGNGNDLAIDDISFMPTCEFGDAPDSYGTTIAAGGAGHVAAGPTLGGLRDVEPDGQPNLTASGDDANGDDEDGVANSIVVTTGQTTTVTVSATNNTDQDVTLAGWIDLDDNGTFDSDELVTVVVPANSGAGSYQLPFPAATTTTDTYARFRIYGEVVDAPLPTGTASAGEVEDYPITVVIPELEITKTSNATADSRPGDTITYTVTAENVGEGDFTDESPAVVIDDLAGVLDNAAYNNDASADLGDDPSYSAPRITWSGGLPSGESVTITYTVTLRAGGDGAVENVAFQPPCDPADAGCQPMTPEQCEDGVDPATGLPCDTVVTELPKLTVVKAANRTDLPAVGEEVVYTVTLTNTGPGDYTANEPATFSDDLGDVLDDATMDETSISATVGSPSFDDPDLNWSGVLASGEFTTITYTLIYTGEGDQLLVNNACVPVEEAQDPQDPCATVRIPGSGLDPDKVSDPDNGEAVDAGDVITYTLRFTNTGQTTATVDTVDDLSGVLDDADITSGPTADTGLAAVLNGDQMEIDGSVPVGESLEITYTVTVRPWAEQGDHVLRNALACQSADGLECEPEVVEHPIRGLDIEKTSDRTEGTEIGDTITYTVTATNIGEADYTALDPAIVQDSLAGVIDDGEYQDDAEADLAGTVSYAEPVLQWSGALAVDEIVTITYTVELTGAGDHVVRNVAWGGDGDEPACDPPTDEGMDPETGVPCDEEEFGLPDVQDSKTVEASDDPLVAGSTLTYTLTFENVGEAAGAVNTVDSLLHVLDDAEVTTPPSASDPALTVSAVEDREFSVTGTLAPDQVVTVTYTVTLKADGERGDNVAANYLLEPGEAVCDPAEPDCEPPPCEPAEGEAPDCTVTLIGEIADSKSVVASDDPLAAGSTLTYTLTFENVGEAAASENTVDDLSHVLDDAELTAAPTVSDTAVSVSALTDGQFTITGSLAAGETVTVTYTVTLKADGERGDNVAANYLLDPTDPAPCDPADPECEPPACVPAVGEEPDCTVTLIGEIVDSKAVEASDDPLVAGSTLTYTLTFENTGGAASDVNQVDDLSHVLDDAELTAAPQASDDALSVSGLTNGQFTITGSLAAGETVTVTYTVTLKADGERGDNVAANYLLEPGEEVCDPAEPDCEPPPCEPAEGEEPDCTITQIGEIVDSKAVDASDDPLVAGSTLTYTLTFENVGEAAAPVDTVDNLLHVLDDADVTMSPSASDPALTVSAVEDSAFSVSGSLAAGQTVTVTYTVTLKADGQRGDNVAANYLLGPTDPEPCDPAEPECEPPPCEPAEGGTPDCTVTLIGEIVDSKAVEASDDPLVAGSTLMYTLTFENVGDAPAHVDTVDNLTHVLDDAELTSAPAASDAALSVSAVADGQFSVTGTLAPDQVVTINYTVTLKADGERGDNVAANYLLDPTDPPPCDPADPECDPPPCEPAEGEEPDCTVTEISEIVDSKSVEASDDPLVAGSTLTYTLTFENVGTGVGDVNKVDNLLHVLDDADLTAGPTVSADSLSVSGLTDGQFSITGSLGAGEVVTVTYAVTVKPDGERGDNLAANYLLDPTDPPPCDPADPECEPPPCEPAEGELPGCTVSQVPEIVDSKSVEASDDPLVAGSTLTYTLTFENTGTAPGAVDKVDSLLHVLDDATVTSPPTASDPALTVAESEEQYSITGMLQPGQVVTVTYTVTVRPDGERGDNLAVNFLLDPGENPPPPEECEPAANDADVVARAMEGDDCTVTPIGEVVDSKSVDPVSGTPVVAGQELTYTLTFENVGGAPAAVDKVDSLIHVLDDATVISPPTPSDSALTVAESEEQYSITGTLQPGQVVTVTYTVRVRIEAERGDDILANFLLKPGEEPPVDPVCEPGEDEAPDCTVNPVGSIAASKSVDPASGTEVSPGQELDYTLTFENVGQGAAAVDFTDHLAGVLDDAELSAGPSASGGGLTLSEVVDGQLTITGELVAGQTVMVTYTVVVKDHDELGDGQLGNFLVPAGQQPPAECVDTDPLCTHNPVEPPADEPPGDDGDPPPSGQPPAPDMPDTGAGVPIVVLLVGLFLLLAGATMVVVRRRAGRSGVADDFTNRR